MHDPELLAERYLAAVDAFIDAIRDLPGELLDAKPSATAWSPRDICFHVADVDSMLGLRLRRILGEDNPQLAGVNTGASIALFRRARLDVSLGLDALSASSALNTSLMERLTPAELVRKGRHSEGHEVSAADLAAFMAMHIEAHIRQLARVSKA